MKLVNTRIAHSDLIVDDEGRFIAAIYYGMADIDGKKGSALFREWFARAVELQEVVSALAESVQDAIKAGDDEVVIDISAAKEDDNVAQT